MAKPFNLKLSRLIPSFRFCRSKRPSNLPENPLPLIYRISPINSKLLDIGFPNFPSPPPPTPEHQHPSFKRQISSKIVSIGCGCRSRLCKPYKSSESGNDSADYAWNTESKLHNSVLVDSTSDEFGIDESRVSIAKPHSNQREKSMRTIASTPSTNRSNFFSSDGDGDEDRETESLISSSSSYSSRSFSNNSSYQFSNSEQSVNESRRRKSKTNNAMKNRRLKSYLSMKNQQNPETKSPVKASVLSRMMACMAEGKVGESVAVVKKSEDPYEDFKKSMLEMILDKQIFDAKDLEQLLQCFLTLNSRNFHGVIVEAFSEIWESLFCNFPVIERTNSFQG